MRKGDTSETALASLGSLALLNDTNPCCKITCASTSRLPTVAALPLLAALLGRIHKLPACGPGWARSDVSPVPIIANVKARKLAVCGSGPAAPACEKGDTSKSLLARFLAALQLGEAQAACRFSSYVKNARLPTVAALLQLAALPLSVRTPPPTERVACRRRRRGPSGTRPRAAGRHWPWPPPRPTGRVARSV
jgi:hypothetical protein